MFIQSNKFPYKILFMLLLSSTVFSAWSGPSWSSLVPRLPGSTDEKILLICALTGGVVVLKVGYDVSGGVKNGFSYLAGLSDSVDDTVENALDAGFDTVEGRIRQAQKDLGKQLVEFKQQINDEVSHAGEGLILQADRFKNTMQLQVHAAGEELDGRADRFRASLREESGEAHEALKRQFQFQKAYAESLEELVGLLVPDDVRKAGFADSIIRGSALVKIQALDSGATEEDIHKNIRTLIQASVGNQGKRLSKDTHKNFKVHFARMNAVSAHGGLHELIGGPLGNNSLPGLHPTSPDFNSKIDLTENIRIASVTFLPSPHLPLS